MKKRVFAGVTLGIAALAGFSALTICLWNWLLPEIFGIATINFWQAVGLLALCRILLGIGGHGFMGRGRMRGGPLHGRNPIHEKWMKMSEEERREFLKKRKRWGFGRGGFPPHHGHWGHDHFHSPAFTEESELNTENEGPKKEAE